MITVADHVADIKSIGYAAIATDTITTGRRQVPRQIAGIGGAVGAMLAGYTNPYGSVGYGVIA